jgi:hypothetical protein
MIPAGHQDVGTFMKEQFDRAGVDPKEGTTETAIDVETLNTTLLWTLT